MRPPIAIVGWGCALPGALDPGALWDLVRTGAVAISPTRDAAWGLDPRADASALATQIASTTGGYVRGLAPDPTGDDSVAYATHAARQAVMSAGLDPSGSRPRGAVILGNLGYPTRAVADDLRARRFRGRSAHDHPHGAAAVVAARLGFGLGGVALDAACASSLVAIGLACDQLLRGDADVVLSGGVNASDDLFLHLGFTALGALSPSGRSRPFHRGADGLVPAHGAAVVLLERLDDALARRAPILGLVRGVGLANDGRTRGALVPDADGQVRAISAAYARAGVDPRRVSYVECHATGTPTGDAVELASLSRVFDGARGLAIGSAKANLGHALTAAGAAGVLKVLAMFAARERPPSPHADDPIDGIGDGLRLVTEVERWTADEPLVAGVDAFGFGGNDAHVVLEAWEGQHRPATAARPAAAAVGVVGWSRAPGAEVDLDGLRLPPADAELALPAHLTGWAVARDAIGDRPLPHRTSVWTVFATDPLVSRCGLRWRWVDAAGGWVTDAPLTPGRVLGCMANLAANRLNAGLDLRGSSGAIAAGADSDGVALAIATHALAHGEVDAALVLGPSAAVVLRRVADAEQVLATIEPRSGATPTHGAPGDVLARIAAGEPLDSGAGGFAVRVRPTGVSAAPGPRRPSGLSVRVVDPAPVTFDDDRPAPPRSIPQTPVDDLRGAAARNAQLAELHVAFLRTQAEVRAHAIRASLPFVADAPPPPPAPEVEGEAPPVPPAAPARPWLDRSALEALASGPIHETFGPAFASLAQFRRVVRMPEPPLLLADRVVSITGAPMSLGTGSVVTETDVVDHAWYLHDGHMPAGLMVEAGQADLLLVSWLGVDQLNRGERVYRLLGCDLTAHGPLPRAGETLRYDITVERHANLGDIRLFFFRYDCTVDGVLRMSVRNGQAGFFTDAELAATGGVVELAAGDAGAPADPYPRPPRAGPMSAEAVARFAAGDPFGAFGDGFERGASHTRSPRIGAGRLQLVERVDALDPSGGPWGRGYLRAALPLSDDAWFFRGHFKDDPCMPGTLMFEGALQAMALFLGASGATLDRDGWRFEPLAEHPYHLRCRGQAVPGSRELVYEVFVRGYQGGERPVLYADLLGTVDGVRAFHCADMALALVPDFPLSDAALRRGTAPDPRAAVVDGHVFDSASLLACAVGRPSAAFGALYAPFDGGRPVPRLPGPPFQFVTRVVAVDGPIGGMEIGSSVTTELDVPDGSWLLRGGSIPVSAWMEIALQPCGWLASYVGCTRTTDAPLAFRNLDGEGEWLRTDVGPGVLTTRARLTSLVRAGDLILVSFASAVDDARGPVFRCTTSFGFFPPAALRDQVGLDRPRLGLPPIHRPLLPDGRLGVLDAVTGHDPARAALRTELAVDPRAWFFAAHFFQDPVQPGSIGVEGMLRSLVELAVAQGWADRAEVELGPAPGRGVTWKYRGQVTPASRRVEVEVVGEPPTDGIVRGDATLWVDGRCIYHVTGLAVGARPPAPRVRVIEVDDAHARAVALFDGRRHDRAAAPADGVPIDATDLRAAVEAALQLPPGEVGQLTADGTRIAVRSDPGPALAHLSLEPPARVGFTAEPTLAGVAAGALAAHHGFLPGKRPWIEPRRRASAGPVTIAADGCADVRPPLVGAPAVPFAVAADDVDGLLTGLDGLVAELFTGDPEPIARRRLAERRNGRLAVVIVARGPDELAAEVERARAAVRGGRRWRTPAGSAFEPEPIGPDAPVAFTFPGIGAAVPGHGIGWLTQFPDLARRLAPVGQARVAAALGERPTRPAALATTTVAQSVLGVGVARALGVEPRFALGYSVGECAMVAALGVWPDLVEVDQALGAAPVFDHHLGGEMTAVRRAWGGGAGWSHVQLGCDADRARDALAGESQVYLATIDTDRSVSVAGRPEAVRRVVERLGATAVPVGVALAIHGEVARREFAAIAELYTRRVEPRRITLLGGAYAEPVPQVPVDLGRALAHGLSQVVDLPRLVRRAWAEGARLFVDPGPRATLARWVSEILGDLPHAAVALAGEGDDDHRPLVRAVAALVAHGVPIDPEAAVPRGLAWGPRIATPGVDLGVVGAALRQVAPGLDPSGLDPDDPLPLDSLARVELRGVLRDTFGVDVPMEVVLGDATPRALGRWTGGAATRPAPAGHAPVRHRATVTQSDMWRMNGRLPPGVDPATFHRTVPVLWTHARVAIRGPLDPDRIADALRATWARWPILGSVYRDGWIERWGAVEPTVERLGPDADPERFFRAGVDPERGPPGRLAVVSVGPDAWEVWIVHHHLFVDGLSARALWEQVLARYFDRPDRPRPTFAEAAAALERWVESPDSGAARAHWASELAGAPRIPLGGGGDPTAPWTAGARIPIAVSPSQLRAVDAAARGASRFAVVLASFARALRVCTGATDLPLVTFHANRDVPGLPGAFDVIGPFAGPLPLRCRGWLDAPPAQRVSEAHALFVRSLSHAHAPVSVLGFAPAVSVVLQSFADPGPTRVGPLEISPPIPVGVGEGHVGLALELVLWPAGDGLAGTLAYATGEVSPSWAARFAAQWAAELDALDP